MNARLTFERSSQLGKIMEPRITGESSRRQWKWSKATKKQDRDEKFNQCWLQDTAEIRVKVGSSVKRVFGTTILTAKNYNSMPVSARTDLNFHKRVYLKDRDRNTEQKFTQFNVFKNVTFARLLYLITYFVN